MSGIRKDELDKRRRQWAGAMYALARELGEEHWITKGMGSLAWGRYDGEPTPNDPVSNVAMGWGFLQGVRYALLQVARGESREGERELSRIHERMGKSSK